MTITCSCGLKHDSLSWIELSFVGIQEIPAIASAPAYALELRNCSCGSTLSREYGPRPTVLKRSPKRVEL